MGGGVELSHCAEELAMLKRIGCGIAVCVLVTATGFAKKKNKPVLPPYIFSAHTVSVVIDPDAGMSIDNPRANEVAQKDVENALLKWGRFQPILGTEGADLIIVVRKGNGKIANETIHDPWQNRRPVGANRTDDGGSVGAQRGPQPPMNDGQASNPGAPSPHPQMEIGATEDTFTVYQGNVDHPLDAVPGWRYVATDALRSHDVPAVGAFRKAMEDAAKAAASKGP